ncbi:centrosomal protein CCDC61 isoform X2 [Tachyglossus aculeatus]|uniref:centrosomal protein CCDC61 isoform X2 n=1 Tax=Tachyglossus aculeatus TaxID=9261 RepID=UPI0018F4A2F4|nr:centrosomal protein CCDC61 isoform X2 [Tachyglossus aculeatus]
MDQPAGLQVDYAFRGVEHVVRLAVSGGGEGRVLELEVEDKMTTDQWRGEFDIAFIEDLTHKTGNFKQFGIFCSMLESALTQSSESVTLDLLTYADLEALRMRKVGARPGPPAPRSALLSSKRYLILVYSVEFDRIHYPLPLPYLGKPDPAALQGVIRALREELAQFKAGTGRDVEIQRLREQLSQAVVEKRELEAALSRARAAEARLEEVRGGHGAPREVVALRQLVRRLEEELLRQRSQHQRAAGHRQQECRQLARELEEVKASERNLRIRLKTVSSELALYKQGRRIPRGPSPSPPTRTERPSSWSRADRSSSRESRPRSRGHPAPSPTGGRAPRFDPTAFVQARQQKQKEVIRNNQRKLRLGPGDPPSGGRARGRPPSRGSGTTLARAGTTGKNRTRSSSVESFRSQRSSFSSGSELEDFSEPLMPRSGRRCLRKSRPPLRASSWNSPAGVPPPSGSRRKRLVSSTPSPGEHGKEIERSEPAAQLSDIDARLQALQEYMTRLDTRT